MENYIKKVIEECGVNTVDEVTELLEQTVERGHIKIACLLNEKHWTKWNRFVVEQIPSAIKWKPVLTSLILDPNNNVFLEVKDEKFINPEDFKHENFNESVYKLVEFSSTGRVKKFKFVEINPVNKEELLLNKIKNKEDLTVDELNDLVNGTIGTIIEENVVSSNHKARTLETVVKFKNETILVPWVKDSFWSVFEQPYLVNKHVEIVTSEKVTWRRM